MKLKLILSIALLILGACAPASQQENRDISSPAADSESIGNLSTVTETAPEQTPLSLSAAPPAESTPEPSDCAAADIRQMANSIAEDYPFSSGEEVIGWFCNGAEFEDILLALETEDLTGTPAEEMLEMLAEGLSWEEIWQVIGLTGE